MNNMVLIVGLGNPGKKFEKTRHNVGFRVIDEFLKKNRDTSNFRSFQLEKKFQAEISKGRVDDEKIILAKPQTSMNNSGKSVKLLIENCKLKIENLFVVHDDIDLPLGKIRISTGRGAAGHKGVESIIKELGTKNFVRFRIGIKPQTTEKPADSYAARQFRQNTKFLARFVLQKFTKDEEKILKEVIKKTTGAIKITIKEGLEKAMAKYNQ